MRVWAFITLGLLFAICSFTAGAQPVREELDPEGHVLQVELGEPGDSDEVLVNLPTPPEDQLQGADIEVHRSGAPDTPDRDLTPPDPAQIPTHRISSPPDESGIRIHRIGGDDQSEIRTHGPGWGDSSGIKVHR